MSTKYRRTTRYIKGAEILQMLNSSEKGWVKLYNFIKDKYKHINEELVYIVRTVENKKNELLYILKVEKVNFLG